MAAVRSSQSDKFDFWGHGDARSVAIQMASDPIELMTDMVHRAESGSKMDLPAMTRYFDSPDLWKSIFDLDHMRTSIRTNPGALLSGLLMVTRYARASNARDKVYGLLGMSSQLSVLEDFGISYEKSVPEVYRDATAAILLSCPWHQMMLFFHYPLWSAANASSPTIPSWTLDFRYTTVQFADIWAIMPRKWEKKESNDDALPLGLHTGSWGMKLSASIVDIIERVVDGPKFPDLKLDTETATLIARGVVDGTHLSVTKDDVMQARHWELIHRWHEELERFLSEACQVYEASQRRRAETGRPKAEPLWQILLGARYAECLTSQADSEEMQLKFDVLAGRAQVPSTFTLLESMFGDSDIKRLYKTVEKTSYTQPLQQELMYALGCNQTRTPENCINFFATTFGHFGIGMPGVRVDDLAAVLFPETEAEIPFVLRYVPEAREYRMVSVAWLQDGWGDLCKKLAQYTPAFGTREIWIQ
jgi:hypothetical protein